jgi:hypothetical protein
MTWHSLSKNDLELEFAQALQLTQNVCIAFEESIVAGNQATHYVGVLKQIQC